MFKNTVDNRFNKQLKYNNRWFFIFAYLVILSALFTINTSYARGSTHVSNNTSEHNSLYIELGEKEGIESVVNAFIKQIVKDKNILRYFAKSNVDHFRQGFIEHMCEFSGGPCHYTGDTMVDIHTGMNINEADFNRIVELLVLAFEDVGLSYRIQNKVIAKLIPMRKNVIKI